RRPRTWRAVCEVFLAAGRGLAATHDAGLVHRDFKPSNVLVGGGRVLVADFGLARGVGAETDAPPGSVLGVGVTGAGGLVGTPGYIAPEVLAGGAATPRSDQYSFCVALAAALRGRRAPRRLARAVEVGLAADPERRHASMAELLALLDRAPLRRRRL